MTPASLCAQLAPAQSPGRAPRHEALAWRLAVARPALRRSLASAGRAPARPLCTRPAAREGASYAALLEVVAAAAADLRRKDEDIRRKDAQLEALLSAGERKDAKLEALHAELLSAATLAAEVRFRNLARLRLANVVELRGALDVCLKSHALHGGSAKVFAELLTMSPHGAVALICCNRDAKVLSDNNGQRHSVETLAIALARIKRRLNKDSHPKTSPARYRDKGDRLLLSREGLSDSDVAIVSCVLKALGYPVEIVDDAELADPPRLAAVAAEATAQD